MSWKPRICLDNGCMVKDTKFEAGVWKGEKTYGISTNFVHTDECDKEWIKLNTPWYKLKEFGGNI